MDIIKRYLLWIILAAVVFAFVIRPDVVQTTLMAFVAIMQTIIGAELGQYIYTRISYTSRTVGKDTDVILAAKIRTLGMIYLGTAVVVGFAWYAVYYIMWLPQR